MFAPTAKDILSRHPHVAVLLSALEANRTEGEWPFGTGWLLSEDRGRRVSIELEEGPWCLFWRAPSGWRMESYQFPFGDEPAFRAVMQSALGL